MVGSGAGTLDRSSRWAALIIPLRCTNRAPGPAGTMQSVRPAKLAKNHQAPDSPHELTTPPQFGMILVDGQNRVSLITDSAVQILGINSKRPRPGRLKNLPSPLQKVIAEARSSR